MKAVILAGGLGTRISEETDTNVKGNFEFMGKNVGGDQSVKTITAGGFDLGKQVL